MPGQPRTIDAGLAGPAQTQTYTLDPTVQFDLEAVYVELDTSGAGGPVTAELVIAEQSGVVIAKKRQSQTVDAGGAGTATWALRLDDESAGSPPPAVTVLEDVCSDTVTLPPAMGGAGVTVPWTNVTAGGVWDYTTPTNPVALRTGLLVVTLQVETHAGTPMTAGSTLFSQLLIPGPAGVFPGVINLAEATEATAAIPGVNQQEAAAGVMIAGTPAVLVLQNNDVNPVDVTYIIRSDLVVT